MFPSVPVNAMEPDAFTVVPIRGPVSRTERVQDASAVRRSPEINREKSSKTGGWEPLFNGLALILTGITAVYVIKYNQDNFPAQRIQLGFSHIREIRYRPFLYPTLRVRAVSKEEQEKIRSSLSPTHMNWRFTCESSSGSGLSREPWLVQ
jgi:hypothetical protein